jgi:alpha-D-ribose 1-methylphosphonate 5-triphosphate synthase subunit PhnG
MTRNEDMKPAGAASDAPETPESGDRRQAMAVLARATAEELQSAWDDWPDKPSVEAVRGPETGLVMLRGRIGGGGAPFNFGEATVTRATVRIATGTVGHAYALGTDRRKVRHGAVFDALWQDEATRSRVEAGVLKPVRERLQARSDCRAAETAATRVDFFTMVRGED